MFQALKNAEIAFTKGEIPVGAVIVDNTRKKIIASSYNLVETRKDATMHAEMIAINNACQILGSKYLINCSLYTTLEPCTMCAGAIAHAKIHSLYYAANDIKQGAVENNISFFSSPSCYHSPVIYSGIYKSQAEELIIKFFKEKVRSNLNFTA